MALGAISAVICLMQVSSGHNILRFQLPADGRPVGLLGSPIDTGALMVVLLTYQLNPLFLVGALATKSTGAILGAAVAVTPARWRIYAFALLSIAGVLGAIYSPSASNVGRRVTWEIALRSASWFGTGPATFRHTFVEYRDRHGYAERFLDQGAKKNYTQVHAHNAMLEALSTMGVLGLVGLLALWFAAPELAGLWTVCMFNPVSFEVAFVACVLAGIYRARRSSWLNAW